MKEMALQKLLWQNNGAITANIRPFIRMHFKSVIF